jgi:uncharacterized protein (DUF1501 family)
MRKALHSRIWDVCSMKRIVMMLGEFGRTPKINKNKGRDHWGPCFFGLFAGAGVRGGQVIDKSDDIAAYPITTPYSRGSTVAR